jgi:hypothetical protein
VSRGITRVVVDIAKLRAYCLSPHHPRGRHKARVFRSRLGLEADDAERLRQMLLQGARANLDHLVPTSADRHGQRYALDLHVTTDRCSGVIHCGWIVHPDDDVLRFVTCFVV